tara:strand:- start:49 stop:279 length:231 start_codon:yes stop_codon:yes gene_type:complete
MITYYITYGNDGGTMELGTDNGFGVFWAGQGLRVLMNIVEKHPDRLKETILNTDKGEEIGISVFLERIEKLKVRTQ